MTGNYYLDIFLAVLVGGLAVYALLRDRVIKHLRDTIDRLSEELGKEKGYNERCHAALHEMRDRAHQAEIRVAQLTEDTNFSPIAELLQRKYEEQQAFYKQMGSMFTAMAETLNNTNQTNQRAIELIYKLETQIK